MLYSEYQNFKRDYQEQGAKFLVEKKHCCLYYKPGKGKTYPCIDAMRIVDKMKKGKAKILILSTPDAIKNMWNLEIVPQHILPTNVTLISLNSAIVEKTKIKLLSEKWDIIIVDECHKIKSHSAKSSKLVYQLSKRTEYVWGLSGTPRGNSDLDIFCQFHNMCISEWGTISYTKFVQTCCDVEKKFFNGQCIQIPIGIKKEFELGWKNNINTYTQRIGYDEEDNMPELNTLVHYIDYAKTQEYKDAENEIINIKNYETTMTKLGAIQKMWQAVNGFMYLTDERTGIVTTYEIERNKKLDWLDKNLQKNTILVYMFQADLLHITEELQKIGCTYTEKPDDFKTNEYDILLLQCSRCESFNLQNCHTMIFYTFDYSYIKYNQMIHRIWRMGQKENVKIHILIHKNSVEENIWYAVNHKEKLADLFMSIKGAIK